MQAYNKDKFFRIINNTQSNYANQLKRLTKDYKRANVILIYYSIALIIYALSIKHFPKIFNENVTSYASVILSVIVLIYSIINNNSRYSERISGVQLGLNKMKSLKRQLGVDGNLDKVRQEYEEIVNNIEIRDDIDFYYTVCQLCKKYGINRFTGKKQPNMLSAPLPEENLDTINCEIRGYISEINPLVQEIHIFLLRIWYIIIYLIPVAIFLLCIYSNNEHLLLLH